MTRGLVPCGAWPSPISAAQAGAAANVLASATAHRGRLYWVEGRPAEGGRNVLVVLGPDGAALDLTTARFNVRSRVHEYGGLAHAHAGDAIVFSNFADQLLYVQEGGRAPRALTLPGYRYADGCAAADGKRLYCVREDHTAPGEAKNSIVAIEPRAAAASAGTVLFDRADFVAYPRPSPDGKRLAFISWNHPHMPFGATTLQVGTLAGDALVDVVPVTGDERDSVLEPRWDRDGSLYFLSDRSGYWNLQRWRGGRGGHVEPVTSLAADFGGPLWQLGAATYALIGDGRALARVTRNAVDELQLVDLASGRCTRLDLPFVAYGSVGVLDGKTACAIAASTSDLPALITIDLASGAWRTVRRSGAVDLSADFISHAQAIEFPTAPGPDGGHRTAHAFFYPARNPAGGAPAGEKPPLIVQLHGGPTSHASAAFSLAIQFWTTRGVAVASVNYGGSTGFGRAYRERLRGQWGVLDLHDAVAAVDFLVHSGRVDPRRIAIRGGSAGGFTVLAGLAFTRRFNAGINYYGVADAEALARDTHKFESRYCDSLIAPLPEGRAVYRARSPLHHVDGFAAPLITFQGAEDRAVPPDQSRRIVEALRAKGVPVAYLEFANEQHGLRAARNITRALEAELYFLGRVFGFTPADALEPVPIDNLPA